MWVIILSIIIALVLIIIYVRNAIKQKVEKSTIELNPENPEKTLLANENGIERLEIKSGKNKIFANWLGHRQNSDSIIIFHGNGESLSDWIETQLLLNELGYNSFVFDYAGFGSSTGTPSIEILNQNAISAWSTFYKVSNRNNSRIAVGHSLGAAVLLGSVNSFQTSPDKLIIHAPFSSAREIAVHFGTAKKQLVWIMPDVWNNKRNIKKIKNLSPHIVHSKSDKKVPYTMSEDIIKCNPGANLLLIEGFEHNDIYEDPKKDLWAHILST